jgi:uncharacterized protein (TIGR00730 family)
MPWRSRIRARFLCRSAWDFLKSMCVLHSTARCVTIFGSARLGEESPAYEVARTLGRSLGRAGFAVMTGGGPGLMEAVNRGVKEGGGRSLGCRMAFAFEQRANPYMDQVTTVRHFFVRKVTMCRQASGFVVLPGGLGTLDELFEVLVLIQTKKVSRVPIILIGTAFWQPLVQVLEAMVAARTLAPREVALIRVTDDLLATVRWLTAPTAAVSEPRELESSAV